MAEPTFLADLDNMPYPSQRAPLVASSAVVATSQPMAAQAGLRLILKGGNAVDAALGAAICLTVVEPTSNGIGADLFCQVWDGHALTGLNGSGRSPAALDREELRRRGHDAVPSRGWLPVTVPGAPRAWADLHARFGRLEFGELFESAIGYAEAGVPVSPITAAYWAEAARVTFGGPSVQRYPAWHQTFAPAGRAPRAGELWTSAGHARTLREIAETGAASFYAGGLADKIVDHARKTDGLLTADDLGRHQSEWVDPIHVRYRGYDIWELPPNGQGLAALLGLNIASDLPVGELGRDSGVEQHYLIEAVKLAMIDAGSHITDPEHEPVPVRELLDASHAAARRRAIGPAVAEPGPGMQHRHGGGTVYVCAADADGMMVSLIQSNYQGFGSGVVVPGTGIALQNRGAGFSPGESHPNRLAPRKRPFHTIIPGFVTRDGQALGPFGVMGGLMQPQGHVQLLANTIDYGLNPQAALDAPRWRWVKDRRVAVEDGPGMDAVARDLAGRGHDVQVEPASGDFGRGQVIWRTGTGTLVAGSDKRADGCAVGY